MTKYFLIDHDGSTVSVLDETLATSPEDAQEAFDCAGWVVGEVMTESEYIESCKNEADLNALESQSPE